MDRETAWIDRLRPLAGAGARGLLDDAAVLAPPSPGAALVATHDVMVAGVHWLPGADPADVAWKLVAVNLSDLAAKGAMPAGVLLGHPLGPDADWDARFADGLGQALRAMAVPLLGGDTVQLAHGGARSLGLTALGWATSDPVPDRRAALAGEALWVAGPIGDAGAGLAQLRAGGAATASLVAAHARPRPLMAEGRVLAGVTRAMLDVSDGLLLDAHRLALASGLGVEIALDQVPLSADFVAARGEGADARLFAATAGDDYALLFTLPPGASPPVPAVRVGTMTAATGLRLTHAGTPLPVPARLGWTHG